MLSILDQNIGFRLIGFLKYFWFWIFYNNDLFCITIIPLKGSTFFSSLVNLVGLCGAIFSSKLHLIGSAFSVGSVYFGGSIPKSLNKITQLSLYSLAVTTHCCVTGSFLYLYLTIGNDFGMFIEN